MRTRSAILVSVLLVLGLLFPTGSWARRDAVVGSLTITKAGGVALSTELVGLAIITTPGWEKMVGQQIPPFTLPIVLDGERDDDDDGAFSGHSRRGPMYTDTNLVLTNTTASPLDLELTVRDGAGAVLLDRAPLTLAAHATISTLLSILVP
jgi:hypothetical protein